MCAAVCVQSMLLEAHHTKSFVCHMFKFFCPAVAGPTSARDRETMSGPLRPLDGVMELIPPGELPPLGSDSEDDDDNDGAGPAASVSRSEARRRCRK